MRLLKLLILVMVVHLGFGCTQVAYSYHVGDVANYGAAGIISHTPIGTFIDLDDPPASMDDQANPNQLKKMLDFGNNLGDMINGLATFGYGFMDDIDSSSGAVYNIVMGFRLISALIWIGAALAFIYFLFDSNLLTSKFGLLALLGISVVGGASGTGALL